MTDLEDLAARNAGWEQALLSRDVEAVADFLHSEYALVIVHPVTAIMRRADWLATLQSYVISSWDPGPPVVDIQDGIAVRHHRVAMQATVFGQDRSGLFILTDCWLRDQDGAPGASGAGTQRPSRQAHCRRPQRDAMVERPDQE